MVDIGIKILVSMLITILFRINGLLPSLDSDSLRRSLLTGLLIDSSTLPIVSLTIFLSQSIISTFNGEPILASTIISTGTFLLGYCFSSSFSLEDVVLLTISKLFSIILLSTYTISPGKPLFINKPFSLYILFTIIPKLLFTNLIPSSISSSLSSFILRRYLVVSITLPIVNPW